MRISPLPLPLTRRELIITHQLLRVVTPEWTAQPKSAQPADAHATDDGKTIFYFISGSVWGVGVHGFFTMVVSHRSAASALRVLHRLSTT